MMREIVRVMVKKSHTRTFVDIVILVLADYLKGIEHVKKAQKWIQIPYINSEV